MRHGISDWNKIGWSRYRGDPSAMLSPLLIASGLMAGCGAPDSGDHEATGTVEQEVVGGFLPGLQMSDPNLLDEALDAFVAVEDIEDGVGPIFNERSCGGCHLEGAVGGSGPNTERRFGRFAGG